MDDQTAEESTKGKPQEGSEKDVRTLEDEILELQNRLKLMTKQVRFQPKQDLK